MTIETVSTIAISDIAAVRLTCKCGARISLPLERLVDKPILMGAMACGRCDQQWFQGTMDSRFQAINGMLTRITDAREMEKDFGLEIRLELKPLAVSRVSGGKD